MNVAWPPKRDETIEELCEILFKNISAPYSMNPEWSWEDMLRHVADESVAEFKLVGCAIVGVVPGAGTGVPSESFLSTVYPLSCSRLALAILAKSSDKLFVASKTPNLHPDTLYRQLIIHDLRFVAIEEALRAENGKRRPRGGR
jgi:hypothetical protein